MKKPGLIKCDQCFESIDRKENHAMIFSPGMTLPYAAHFGCLNDMVEALMHDQDQGMPILEWTVMDWIDGILKKETYHSLRHITAEYLTAKRG